MSFGNQTVVFVHYEPTGEPDALGSRTLAAQRTAVAGCRHRPVTMQSGGGAGLAMAEQQPEIGVSVATQWWRTTIPWSELSDSQAAVVLGARPSDVIEVEGVPYQIISGVAPFTDFSGPFKVTITSERQTIG